MLKVFRGENLVDDKETPFHLIIKYQRIEANIKMWFLTVMFHLFPTVESNMKKIEKALWESNLKAVSLKSDFKINQSLADYFKTHSIIILNLDVNGWTIGNEEEIEIIETI